MTDGSSGSDVCGAETAAGTPCELPASRDDGRCHQHTETGERNRGGRPSKLEDRREQILLAARSGATKKGVARAASVHESTLYRWLNRNETFQREFWRARWEAERRYIENPDGVDCRHAQFMLERSFGYTKSSTIRHSADTAVEFEVSGSA